jgi:hypothetical protein
MFIQKIQNVYNLIAIPFHALLAGAFLAGAADVAQALGAYTIPGRPKSTLSVCSHQMIDALSIFVERHSVFHISKTALSWGFIVCVITNTPY